MTFITFLLSLLEDIVNLRDCYSNTLANYIPHKRPFFYHLVQAWERQNNSSCADINKVCHRTMCFSKTLTQEKHVFLGTSEYFQLTRNSVKYLKCFSVQLELWLEISQYQLLKLKDSISIMRLHSRNIFDAKKPSMLFKINSHNYD